MFEVPAAGEDHGQSVAIAGGNALFVVARTARLDDRYHAGGGRLLDRVGEGKEGVGGHDAPSRGRPPF